VQWLVENLLSRTGFNDFAGVHDCGSMGPLRNDSQIMGDQDQPHAIFTFQVVNEFEYLGLNGYIECCCWLIGNQKTRLAGKRHGYHDSLTHAAAQLVGIVVVPRCRRWNAYLVEHFEGCLFRNALRQLSVEQQSFRDLITDTKNRIQ